MYTNRRVIKIEILIEKFAKNFACNLLVTKVRIRIEKAHKHSVQQELQNDMRKYSQSLICRPV
jgi:translation initiation factor 1 (eIF-1/SUI1)